MGTVNIIKCDTCSVSFKTVDNFNGLFYQTNGPYDFYDELYCPKCEKVVKVWIEKDGKILDRICPICESSNLFLIVPEDAIVKCQKCKDGNLESETIMYSD